MSSLGTRDDFTIMRLRVNGTTLDPLAVRPRVEQLVSEFRLYPLLPESASVFIRKLDDPSPGLLRLDAIDSRATQNWRRSFNSRFRELVTSAARPAHGPVSSSVESVVFLDYSELLACLTADWCNGVVGTRWWWHSFLKRGDIAEVIKSLWQEKIQYAPAALQQLAKTHVVVEFVSQLSDGESSKLIERLTETFDLPAIRRVLDSSPLPEKEASAVAAVSPQSPSISIKEVALQTPAPWKHVVPECDTPRLRPLQQLFLAVALMIKRAPNYVRTQTFAREVERWHTHVLQPDFPHTADPVIDPSHPIQSVRSAVKSHLHFSDSPELEELQIEPPAPQPVPTQPEVRTNVPPEVHYAAEPLLETAFQTLVPVAESEPAPQEIPIVDSVTIETELGGLFYLINLGIFLDLYSDFTSPVETFTELSIWDFVALVGSQLNDRENDDDQIWSLLAELAGREDEPLPEKTLIWLSHLMPYLRKRLRLALGTDDFPNILLRHRARVTLTATHIDVFFSLTELPIEIRLSGLDRDPGWVPAAGRFIAFHFD